MLVIRNWKNDGLWEEAWRDKRDECIKDGELELKRVKAPRRNQIKKIRSNLISDILLIKWANFRQMIKEKSKKKKGDRKNMKQKLKTKRSSNRHRKRNRNVWNSKLRERNRRKLKIIKKRKLAKKNKKN